MIKINIPGSQLLLAVATFIGLGVSEIQAAVHEWQGPEGGLWSNPDNWTNGLPTSGEEGGTILRFKGIPDAEGGSIVSVDPGLHSICDIEITVDRIEFAGSGHLIDGDNVHSLTISTSVITDANILNNVGTNTLGGTDTATLPIIIKGNSVININSPGGKLNLAAAFKDDPDYTGIKKGGVRFLGGEVSIMSTQSSYTGSTTVINGIVELAATAINKAVPGDLYIGDDVGDEETAVVLLRASEQISDSAKITIFSDGMLDLNNKAENIGPLTLVSGIISEGTLHLGGDVTAYRSSVILANITLNAAQRVFNTPEDSYDLDLRIWGEISDGTTPSGIYKDGWGGIHVRNSGNSYTGTTKINRGHWEVSADGDYAIRGPLIIGNEHDDFESAILITSDHNYNLPNNIPITINSSGLFQIESDYESVGSINGNGGVYIRYSSSKLYVGATHLDSQLTGDLSGSGTLIKLGNGTLNLAGEDFDFYGDIDIETGVLAISGWYSGVENVFVQDGATLAGNGFIGGQIRTESAAAFISPAGSGTGMLTAGDADLSAGASILITIDDSSSWLHDTLVSEDNLDISGSSLTINVTDTASRNAYIIASFRDRPNDAAVFQTVNGIPSGYVLNYNYNDGSPMRHIALVRTTPAAVTLAATNVTGSSTSLNGTVNPDGKATSYYFQYGETSQFGLRTPTVKNVTATKNVTAAVSKLISGRTYYFQLVAINSSGTSHGDTFTFQTPGAIVTTDSANSVTATTAQLTGTVNPNSIKATAWFEYGLTPSLGSKTDIRYSGSDNVATTVTAQLIGLRFGQRYYVRLVASTTSGISQGDIQTFTTEIVNPPVIEYNTPSWLCYEGTPLYLFVNATDYSPSSHASQLRFQWNRNGKPIPGATSPVFFVVRASANHAGTYTCTVTNLAGRATTGTVEVGIIEAPSRKSISQAIGGTATLSFRITGNNLHYQWLKNEKFPIPGATGKTLALTNLQPSDYGRYACAVTDGNQSYLATEIVVSANTSTPVILTPITPPETVVGGEYTYQIPIDTAPHKAPSTFTIKNLPPGLTVNSSGLISGRVNKAHPIAKEYTLSIKAANASGTSAEVTATIKVHPFPSSVVGVYSGIIERSYLDSTLDNGMGGYFTATITELGSCSGKLIIAGVTQSFTTPVVARIGVLEVSAFSSITSSSKGEMTIYFDVNENGKLEGALITTNMESTSIYAVRNPWKAGSNAFPHPGTYTLQIGLPTDSEDISEPEIPQGRSYATATVTAGGTVTLVSKIADGSAPATFATTLADLDPDYEDYLCFVQLMLNKTNSSSIQGYLAIREDEETPLNNGKPLLEGSLDWSKAYIPGSKDRTYSAGFEQVSLEALGGIYTPPATNTPILNLIPGTVAGVNNALLKFNEGGLSGTDATLVNRGLRITPANVADFSSNAVGATAAALKLKITPKTGIITGSFLATDGDVNRTVNFGGIVVQRSDVNSASGYFLRPESGPTTATAPILSGEFLLLPPP